MYHSATTHSKNETAKISMSGITIGSQEVTMAIPDAAFSGVRFCSYTQQFYN